MKFKQLNLSQLLPKRLFKFELPEKLKGGRIEKLTNYLLDVKRDYTESILDIFRDSKKNPLKASIYLAGLSTLFYAIEENPDLDEFEDSIRKYMNDSALIGDKIRNKTVDKHMNYMVDCMNHDTIRRLSFGIGSIIWVDNYPKDCGLFKAQCSYLKPRYFTFHERIVDVGMFGTWWNIHNMFKTFDVNDEEWPEVPKS